MSTFDGLQRRLDDGEVVVLDGGTGTELERRGVPMDSAAWSGAAIHTHPEVVRQVHEDYIQAGADIVITNTFATCRHSLEGAGLGDFVAEINSRSVSLAKDAIEAAEVDRSIYVAGAISTFQTRNNSEFMPSLDVAKANYREQAELLAEAGVDLLMMEMMVDLEQSALAIESAESTGLPVWVGYSCRTDEDGGQVLLLNRERDDAFAEALEQLGGLGGSLIAVMHTVIEDTVPALSVVKEKWSGSVGAFPHSGNFVMPNWQFKDIMSPEDYLAEAQKWARMGVQVIGGCCGTTPEHIKALKDGLPTHVPWA
jgi:homocysteine S-methyltransferase